MCLHVAPVDVVLDVDVDVTCVPCLQYGDGDFRGVDVRCGPFRLPRDSRVVRCGQFVDVDVQFGFRRELSVRLGGILVAFYPLCLHRSSEFFEELLDDGDIVDVIRLFGWFVVRSSDYGDSR